MSFFEYVVVIAAILLGLGFAQLMRVASDIVRARSYHFAHFTWLVALVVVHLQLWWAFWDLEALPLEAWNAGKFVFFVLGPGILFFTSNILAPDQRADDTDWGEHFADSRLPFLLMVALLIAWVGGLGSLLLGAPLLHPTRVGQLIAISICLVGVGFPSQRVQRFVAAAFLTAVVGNWLLLRWTPGVLGG
jgi:hypothetical protein